MAGPEGITLAASVLFRSETITIVIDYETMPDVKESRDIAFVSNFDYFAIEDWKLKYWRRVAFSLIGDDQT